MGISLEETGKTETDRQSCIQRFWTNSYLGQGHTTGVEILKATYSDLYKALDEPL